MVESSSRKAFDMAMKLAFMPHPEATHFLIDEEADALVMFWSDPAAGWPKAVKLPAPARVEQATDWAWEWLRLRLAEKRRPSTYADGLNAAFTIKAGGEFRLLWRAGYMPSAGSPYGIVAVYPTWSEVHK